MFVPLMLAIICALVIMFEIYWRAVTLMQSPSRRTERYFV